MIGWFVKKRPGKCLKYGVIDGCKLKGLKNKKRKSYGKTEFKGKHHQERGDKLVGHTLRYAALVKAVTEGSVKRSKSRGEARNRVQETDSHGV